MPTNKKTKRKLEPLTPADEGIYASRLDAQNALEQEQPMNDEDRKDLLDIQETIEKLQSQLVCLVCDNKHGLIGNKEYRERKK